jgi:alpha-glucosidase
VDHTEGDPALFARWMGIGCLLPFARGHVARGCVDKEPWSLGPECEATCRRAIERRYRLLPYLYTLAWRAHDAGAPIAAPVCFADPTDPGLRGEDRAFLVGEDLMAICDVRPDGDAADDTPVRFPARGWRPLTLGEDDPDLPRLRLREGAAIPTGPVMQHSDERPVDPLIVVAAPDADGRAEGLLYEDAGDGFGFERGEYRLSRIVVERGAGGARVALEHVGGDLPETPRAVELRVV